MKYFVDLFVDVQGIGMVSFGIVIPNLNQSRFLQTALESLRYQSAQFQLAIMDGGSKDNFDEIVNKYADIITFLRSGSDEGQAAAIKEGEERISGDIFAWLNADDYYFPGALDKVLSLFEKHPDLDVVYGDAIHVNPEGFFLSYFPAIEEYNAKRLTRTCFICQPACFVRRSAYQGVRGINPNFHYTMDWDLWCRLSNFGAKFLYLREVLAAVRYYPGTKTLSGDLKRYKEIYRIEKEYGRRLLPRSWLGSYLFDLSFQKRNKLSEKYAFTLLSHLRKVKKRIINKNDLSNNRVETIYGFNRWEPIVERRCTIQLPWFDKREWTRLYLKVDPADNEYRIEINNQLCSDVFLEDDCLVTEVKTLGEPHRKIAIESLHKERWKLLEFRCELTHG